MLRNYFHLNEESRIRICKTDFVTVVGRIWPHSLSRYGFCDIRNFYSTLELFVQFFPEGRNVIICFSEKLQRSLLQMLLNFTHKSLLACSCIASKPLINSILKQFSLFRNQIKVKVKASSIFALNFQLMNNLALSIEARAQFWKGKVFLDFVYQLIVYQPLAP